MDVVCMGPSRFDVLKFLHYGDCPVIMKVMTCTAACLGRSLWEENRIRLKHLRWEPHQCQWLYSEVRRDSKNSGHVLPCVRHAVLCASLGLYQDNDIWICVLEIPELSGKQTYFLYKVMG